MAAPDVEGWFSRQAARSPLSIGLFMGVFSGGLSLAAQLGNPEPQPLWAVGHFVISFAFGVFLGRRERRRQQE